MLNMMDKRKREPSLYQEEEKPSSSDRGFKQAASMMMTAIKSDDVESFASSLKAALKFLDHEKEMSN